MIFSNNFRALWKFSQDPFGTDALSGCRPLRGAVAPRRPRLAQRKGAEMIRTMKPRRRARRAPAGFHTVTALGEAGDPPRSTLYRLIKNGRLPVHQWRGQYVIADADFAKLNAVMPLTVATDAADAEERRDD